MSLSKGIKQLDNKGSRFSSKAHKGNDSEHYIFALMSVSITDLSQNRHLYLLNIYIYYILLKYVAFLC